MSLLAKKISLLTPAEHQELFKAVGTPDLPYPSIRFVPGSDGSLEPEMGVIADYSNPLGVHSDQSHERVVGILYREMAIPSMLHIQEEAILKRAPDSKNRLMAILGAPGSGKSHLAKMMGRLRDSRGADVVDCGGRYMGDLLFEQVIDFGEDFKTALTDRIKSGAISEKTVQIFDEEFPGALQRNDEKQVDDIDWDVIGQPKKIGDTEGKSEFESAAQSTKRAMDIIEGTIAKWESIPTQTTNNLGIKKQFGPLIRSWLNGQEVVLDEYTKSVEGTDDSLQTVLQFFNGEIDEAQVENTIKVNGREETQSFVFRREDMKSGFFATITGNKQADGISTHTLSRSAYDRIDVFEIEDPSLLDWEHRIGQVLTGLPLKTMYALFHKLSVPDPEDFGDAMVELRLMGLTDDERKRVPYHQLSMLKNWEKTIEAITKLAEFYMYWQQMVDPESDKYDMGLPQNNGNIEHILPEIDHEFRDQISIGFRKFMKDIESTMLPKPDVQAFQASTNLSLNFSAIGRQKVAPPSTKPEILASSFGTRLQTVLMKQVGTITRGRPHLQAELRREAESKGIFGDRMPNDNIASLLDQDQFSDVGGMERIVKFQNIFAHRFRRLNPALQQKSIDEIVPLEDAAKLCKKLAKKVSNDNTAPFSGKILTLGDSLKNAFKDVSAKDGITGRKKGQMTEKQKEEIEPSQLMTVSDFLEALQVPEIAKQNMREIWMETLSLDKTITKDASEKDKEQYQSIFGIAENNHDKGVGLTTLMAQNEDGEETPIHIICDIIRQKTLIVTKGVDPEMRSALGADYVLVDFEDMDVELEVHKFIADILKEPSRRADAEILEGQLLVAFTWRAGDPSSVNKLSALISEQSTPIVAPVYMLG